MKPNATVWTEVAALFRLERAKLGLSQIQVAEALVERFKMAAKPTSVRTSVVAAEGLSPTARGRVPPTVTYLAIYYGCEDVVDAILSGGRRARGPDPVHSPPKALPAIVRYLSLDDIAEQLGLDATTIRTDRSRGGVPEPDAMIGSTPGWLPATVDDWVSARPGRGVSGGRKPEANPRDGGRQAGGWLTVPEVAEYMGVSVQTVYRHIHAGRLATVNASTGGTKTRVTPAALADFERANTTPAYKGPRGQSRRQGDGRS
jgi:excisionase family DNA binding protein